MSVFSLLITEQRSTVHRELAELVETVFTSVTLLSLDDQGKTKKLMDSLHATGLDQQVQARNDSYTNGDIQTVNMLPLPAERSSAQFHLSSGRLGSLVTEPLETVYSCQSAER